MPVIIPLTRGYEAIVDDNDADLVKAYSWRAQPRPGGNCYAITGAHDTTLMHRLVLGVAKGVRIDHRNGNGLDNRRDNLRLATQAQNSKNRRPQANNSGYKGVCLQSSKNRWLAQIASDGKHYHIGYFDTAEEAARAYDAAALRLHGEFARTNF